MLFQFDDDGALAALSTGSSSGWVWWVQVSTSV